MRVVLFGDTGSSEAADESAEVTVQAAVENLLARGVDAVTVLSRDPERTVAHNTYSVIARLGFPPKPSPEARREERLAAVARAVAGHADALEWADPAWSVIHAIDEADAVVVMGGEWLNTNRPENLCELAGLAAIARAFSTPLVVGSPFVNGRCLPRQAVLLADIDSLTVTENPTRQVTTVAYHPSVPDPVAYLTPGPAPVNVPTTPYVLVALGEQADFLTPERHQAAVTSVLRNVATATDMPVVVLGTIGDAAQLTTGHVAKRRALANDLAGHTLVFLGPTTAQSAAAAIRDAAMVVSSRHVPVALALGNCVPVVGLGLDAHGAAHISRAMESFGVSDFALSAGSLVNDGAADAIASVAARRDEFRQHLVAVNAVRSAESSAWWDAIAATIQGVEGTMTQPRMKRVKRLEGGEWASVSKGLTAWSDEVVAQVEAYRLASEQATAEVAMREDQAVEMERELAALAADLAAAEREIEELRASANAAHRLISEPVGKLWVSEHDGKRADLLQAELNRYYQTRTFRLLKRPRELYAKAFLRGR